MKKLNGALRSFVLSGLIVFSAGMHSSQAQQTQCVDFKSRGGCIFAEPNDAKGCLDIVGRYLFLEDLVFCQTAVSWSDLPCSKEHSVLTCQYGDADKLMVRTFYPPYSEGKAALECAKTGGLPCSK